MPVLDYQVRSNSNRPYFLSVQVPSPYSSRAHTLQSPAACTRVQIQVFHSNRYFYMLLEHWGVLPVVNVILLAGRVLQYNTTGARVQVL